MMESALPPVDPQRGAEVYAKAVEIADALPPRDREEPHRLDVIVLHARAGNAVHQGRSHDNRILEVGFGAALLGHRTRRIVVDCRALMDVMADDTMHGRRTRDWFRHSMCRLEPGGHTLLV